MPDISLLDENGKPQTYPDVDELEVDAATGGTAKYVSDHLIHNQVQSNWEQYDSTQPDFIKNKPAIPAAQVPADWDQLDPANPGVILNKPFGVLPDVMVQRDVPFFKINELNSLFCGFVDSVPSLTIGARYAVYWDETKYECVADLADLAEAPEPVPFIGNGLLLPVEGVVATDTGEPFMLIGDMFFTNQTDDSHNIRITLLENEKKLDAKWLPDGIATEEFVREQIAGIENSGGTSATETDIFWGDIQDKPFGEEVAEVSVSGGDIDPDTIFDGLGYRWYWYGDDTLTLSQLIGATVTLAVRYTDNVHKIEYVISADNIMAANKNGTAVLFNEGAFIMAYQTGTVTLEAMGQNVTVSIPKAGLYFVGDEVGSYMSDSDSLTISTTKTVTLDPKYIPGLPTFDLTAMGLPAISVGGTVTAECDTAELIAALDKGPVKLQCQVDTGIVVNASLVAGAFCMDGAYVVGYTIYALGMPLLFTMYITASGLEAVCIPLMTSST